MKLNFSAEIVWIRTIAGLLFFAFTCCINFQVVGSETGTPPPCSLDSVVVTSTSCNGICDGEVDVYIDCNLPLHFTWSGLPGLNTPNISGICPGTYYFTATDSARCNISDSIVITEPPPVAFNIISQGTSCPGGCTGFLTVVPLDTLPYTFYWPGYMSTGPVLNTLCQGTYNVIVTDVNGCSRIESADVDYIPPFQLSFIPNAASCLSACNGNATVTANGTPPFNYQWGTGPIQNTQTAFNLCVGSYVVNVTDSIGCTVSDSVYIDHFAPVDIVTGSVSPTCFGGCDGTATATIDPPGGYSFVWNTSPPQFTSTATGLCSGIYTVAVTDLQSGCEYFQSVDVVDPTASTLSFSVTPAYCNNSCSGAVTVTSGPAPVVNYLWSTGSNSQSDSLLCPGIYTVTVTDALGCSSSGSVSVNAESLVLYSGSATCNNVCDGTAGIVLPFQSLWIIDWLTVPVQHTTQISGLCEGLYSVAIVDSSGCELNGMVQVEAAQPVNAYAAVTDVSCAGMCDGSVNLFVSGNDPFQIVWDTSPVQFGDSVSGLCSDSYQVTITDFFGCSLVDTVVVGQPEPAMINYFTVPNSCSQNCDAVVEAIPASSGLYSFQWLTSPVQTGSVASGLCPGQVFIEVTDSSGCTSVDSLMIVDTPPINISLNVTGVSCPFSCDGFIACLASGGNPGFTYQWSNGFQTPQLVNVCSGTYSVTVTDVRGCTGITAATLVDPDPLIVNFDVVAASCSTCTDGSIEAFVTGGTEPYFYFWTPGGAGGAVIDTLLPGLYNFCVIDENNCTYCEDVFVADITGLNETEQHPHTIKLYPNPFSESAELFVDDQSRIFSGKYSFTFTDIRGRIVDDFSVKFRGQNQGGVHFEIVNHQVTDGIYFFRLMMDDNTFYNGRFVICGTGK